MSRSHHGTAVLERAPWLGPAALAAAIVAGDLIIALGFVNARAERLVLLGLGVVALALVFRFPLAASCTVIVLLASIVAPGRLKFPAGPIEWRLEELLLGGLLILALVRPRRAWWGGVAGGALAVFFVVLGFSAVLALESARAPFADVFGYCRFFAPLLLFYVIVRLFEPEQVRRLLLFAVVVAAVAAVVSLAAAKPGSTLASTLNPDDTAAIRDKEGLGLLNRVRLPGVSLAYVLFWYAVVQALAARRGAALAGWVAAVAAMGLGIALSFNRNMWLGLVLGLVMLLAAGHGLSRSRLTAALAVLAAGAVAIALAGPQLSSSSPLYPLVVRGTTLLHPVQESRDPSLDDRRIETRFAVAAIERHPVLGVGPGVPYGTGWLWVHNQYLHLLLIGGPVALLSLLVFLGAPVATVVRERRGDEPLLALAVGIAITAVSALVMISIVNATWAAVLGLLCGSLTVLTRTNDQAP